MIDINELRRLARAATPGPWGNTDALDPTRINSPYDQVAICYRNSRALANAAFIAAANPATVSELLERLEAAESDALEQARLNGMGSEREAALMAKLKAAEKERDVLRDRLALESQENGALRDSVDRACEERDSLRAKVEAMEKQAPVGTLHDDGYFVWSTPCPYESNFAGWRTKLYALPGAQPAPSVPEGWKLVPTAESRHPGIYKMLRVLHAVDNTPGASEWESYAAFLAAAPEAKP